MGDDGGFRNCRATASVAMSSARQAERLPYKAKYETGNAATERRGYSARRRLLQMVSFDEGDLKRGGFAGEDGGVVAGGEGDQEGGFGVVRGRDFGGLA